MSWRKKYRRIEFGRRENQENMGVCVWVVALDEINELE
jgi:hypothetical protein